MSFYLDASALVPIFVADQHMPRTTAFLRDLRPLLVVSDFAAAEFASAVSRRVRTLEITVDQAESTFANFDDWVASRVSRAQTLSSDVRQAEAAIRRLDTPLRAPDALNIAIARRLEATLVTFDRAMAESARRLGLAVADI